MQKKLAGVREKTKEEVDNMITEHKVLAVGRKTSPSYHLIMPKFWCKQKGIGKGDTVYTIITGEAMIVTPHKAYADSIAKAFKVEEEVKNRKEQNKELFKSISKTMNRRKP